MKYINLEHPASICSIVLFVYKPPWGEEHEGRRGTWQAYWLKESAATWLVGLHRNISVFSIKDRKVEVLCATSLMSQTKGGDGEHKSPRTTFVWVTPPMCPPIAASEWVMEFAAFWKRLWKCLHPVIHFRWFSFADILCSSDIKVWKSVICGRRKSAS